MREMEEPNIRLQNLYDMMEAKNSIAKQLETIIPYFENENFSSGAVNE